MGRATDAQARVAPAKPAPGTRHPGPRVGTLTFYALRFTRAVRARVFVGILILLPFVSLAARSAAQTKPPPLPAEAEKISDNVIRIGKVIVDLKARTVTCAAKINMQRGAVEYLAVGTRGKLHEIVLEVDARPLHIQLGLILLGLEPQGGLRYQGDTRLPKGPPVEVWVSWEKAGREVKVRGEELVWDVNR